MIKWRTSLTRKTLILKTFSLWVLSRMLYKDSLHLRRSMIWILKDYMSCWP